MKLFDPFTLFSAIVSVYCVLRLVEMALAAYRQEQEERATKGASRTKDVWWLYVVGAVLILVFLFFIFQQVDEMAKALPGAGQPAPPPPR
jgi:hypothetical protein